ncbi:MAG: YoaK family protein [Solirubrobacteraceae bacterium]|jgi:uncharacterized membrane protein YoaK (UPF0700 family)
MAGGGLRAIAVARWPWRGIGQGPLPALLLGLTVVTGLVDAVSYVALGHVFVANMTGNVVFLGFAIAGARGLSVTASLVALAAFFAGALAGGRICVASGPHRGRQLVAVSSAGGALLVIAAIVAAIAGTPVSPAARYGLIVALALAMGGQNAMARRLAVPDLTTTVLTLTLTGVAADSRLAGGSGGRPARRLLAVAAMLAGALISALLVLHVDLVLPIALAALLVEGIALAAHRLATQPGAEWAGAPGQG